MRKYFAILLIAAAACSSNSSNQTAVNISPNQVPAAVQAAFNSEHPYAQLDKPIQQANTNNRTSYIIPYTRSDGSKGLAIYSSYGELQKDQ